MYSPPTAFVERVADDDGHTDGGDESSDGEGDDQHRPTVIIVSRLRLTVRPLVPPATSAADTINNGL